MMDRGHYNCRDYAFNPHFAPTTLANDHRLRHESFEELEARCRSPASQKPKFPLLKLPLELRQQILGYLLPYTQEYRDCGLREHVRNFSAVKRREAKGMVVPKSTGMTSHAVSNIVWCRGNTKILSVCKQLHQEGAELLYGTNTFLLFVTYAEVKFRYRWLLPSGVAPIREYQFLDSMPRRYIRLVGKLVVNIDHVDGYTGMVKFNVSGRGLAVGLRNRVQSLVNALRVVDSPSSEDDLENGGDPVPEIRRMSRIIVRVSNANATIDGLKCRRESELNINADIETILAPLGQLRNVGSARISGAVADTFARDLEDLMESSQPVQKETNRPSFLEDGIASMKRHGIQLCVYGNDL